jgi:hypothetical protein
LRIYRRGNFHLIRNRNTSLGHGWARDSKLAGNHWSDYDFMFHSWKASKLNTTWFDADVFTEIPNPDKCSRSLDGKSFRINVETFVLGWKWRPELHVPVEYIRKQLGAYESGVAKGYPKEGRDLPHLVEPDIRECYPDCDKYT